MVTQRNSLVSYAICSASAIATCHVALAQPETVDSVPIKVECRADGTAVVVTRAIPSIPVSSLSEMVHEFVPVDYSLLPGQSGPQLRRDVVTGRWKKGDWVRYPGYVVLLPDGTWSVRYVLAGARPISPQAVSIIGSERARLGRVAESKSLDVLPLLPGLRDRSGGPVFYTYSHSGAPEYLANFESEIRSAFQRACDSWNDVLRNSSFQLTVAIVWDPTLSENAATDRSSRETRNWTILRQNLIAGALDNFDFNVDEIDLYGATPSGSSIPYKYGLAGSSSTSSTSGIVLSVAQIDQIYGFSSLAPVQIVLSAKLTKQFTTEARRFGLLDGQHDLEATIVHEIGHALGFDTELDALQSFFNSEVSLLDVFRFSVPDAPLLPTRSVGSSEVFSGFREIRQGTPAQIVTALDDAARCYITSASIGSDFDDIIGDQPGHWGDYSIESDKYIGIMKTATVAGVTRFKNGRYIQLPDVRAMDILGFAIRPSNWQAGPQAAALLTPADNQTVALASVNCTWTSGSGAFTDHFSAYDVGAGGGRDRVPVVQVPNVVGETYSIPAASLRPGVTYEWYVASENTRGSSFASRRFTVSGTPCPCDFNNDGVVEDADFTIFVNAYAILDCADPIMPIGCRSDLNNDGFVDDADFSIFVVAYDNLLCP